MHFAAKIAQYFGVTIGTIWVITGMAQMFTGAPGHLFENLLGFNSGGGKADLPDTMGSQISLFDNFVDDVSQRREFNWQNESNSAELANTTL